MTADPEERERQPLVALVGRPNVGKSTLFNRLIGERVAVVEDFPGTTRDRIYGELEWRGRTFAIVDTAGIAWRDPEPVAAAAIRQAQMAAQEADVLLVVTDVRTGPTDLDLAVANQIRRADRPYLLVVNKADSQPQREDVSEFYGLGLGEPLALSALHGTASGELLDAIVERLPARQFDQAAEDLPQFAIVGRPNVGKSSLLNALLGQERALVHESAGTTRDAIDTELRWEDQEVRLIDTAGMRRPGHVTPGVEYHSVLRSIRAVQRADVGLLVVDASEGATAQDAHIAGLLLEASKGLAIVANKWDLLEGAEARDVAEEGLRRVLHFAPESPLVRVSALTGRNVAAVMPAALDVYAARQVRVTTSKLNQFLRAWIGRRDPPGRKGRHATFKYATQVGANPPAFLLFFSRPELIHRTYVRYLQNGLREEYALHGTPIVLRLRES